jgi:hypothetical protein
MLAVHLFGLFLQKPNPNQERRTTMYETNIVEFSGREARLDPLTELLRTGAQDLIQAAVQTELYCESLRTRRSC